MNVGSWLRWWGAGGAGSLVLLLGAEVERTTPWEETPDRPPASWIAPDRAGANADGNREGVSRERPTTSPAAKNPLAPFLDRWLSASSSPSHLDAPASLPSAPAAEGRHLRPGTNRMLVPVLTSVAPVGNPYIEAMPGRREGGEAAAEPEAEAKTLPPAVRPRPVSEESRVVAPTLVAPEASVRTPEPAYRPPPKRDTKYFPQQKRF